MTREDLQAIAGLLQPIQAIQEDIQELKRRATAIEDAVQTLNQRTTNIEATVQDLKRRTTSIELTLENETNRNIKLIAEGHLDLSRKLDDALKVENEKELRKVRERLAQIA